MSNKQKLAPWRSRVSARWVAETPKESHRTAQRLYYHYHQQMVVAE